MVYLRGISGYKVVAGGELKDTGEASSMGMFCVVLINVTSG